MNVLDILIGLILISYAVSGYFQGFVSNIVATIGLLTGGLLAIALVPHVMAGRTPTLTSSLIALISVIAAGAIGQAIGTHLGGVLREGISWRPLRRIDAMAGSVLSMVAVLCAAWALGYAMSGTQIPVVSAEVRGSTVLGTVNRVMPHGATDVLDSFNQVLDTNVFPHYLEPFENEKIIPVGPPSDGSLSAKGVQIASRSVVKIVGSAVCNRGIEGSGFVYGTDRIMTNAHVVAGVAKPFVVLGQRRLPAEVVVFDRKLDVAVLAVPGLGLSPLKFDNSGQAGDPAVVLGFPENGPFDARAARIRLEQSLRSPDIYNRGQVVRDTFAIRGLVRSGNSGGPLVSEQGRVLGVIFAASITNKDTGYALTAKQVEAAAAAGISSSRRVSTSGCT